MYEEQTQMPDSVDLGKLTKKDTEIIQESILLSKYVTKKLEQYQFKLALEKIYSFVWERLANEYLEEIKNNNNINSMQNFKQVFKRSLKLLHPFMPFITEAVWQKLFQAKQQGMLIVENWPEVK